MGGIKLKKEGKGREGRKSRVRKTSYNKSVTNLSNSDTMKRCSLQQKKSKSLRTLCSSASPCALMYCNNLISSRDWSKKSLLFFITQKEKRREEENKRRVEKERRRRGEQKRREEEERRRGEQKRRGEGERIRGEKRRKERIKKCKRRKKMEEKEGQGGVGMRGKGVGRKCSVVQCRVRQGEESIKQKRIDGSGKER